MNYDFEQYIPQNIFSKNTLDKDTHILKIKIIEHVYGIFGIISNDIEPSNIEGSFVFEQTGYGYGGCIGELYTGSGNKKETQIYGRKLKKNDVLTIMVDMNYKTMTYKFNKEFYGVAFKNIDKSANCKTFKFAASFNHKTEKIKVIKYKIQKKSAIYMNPLIHQIGIYYVLIKSKPFEFKIRANDLNGYGCVIYWKSKKSKNIKIPSQIIFINDNFIKNQKFKKIMFKILTIKLPITLGLMRLKQQTIASFME